MVKHNISFKYAIDGILYCFRTQPNFQIHIIAAALVLFSAWFFKISYSNLIILLFTIMLVIVAEMLNTAVEAMTDLITITHHQSAKIAKDVAAGMVLMSAFLAVIIGITIFVPAILKLINA
jgi:diacylglycerol kinase (ATP)